MSNKPIPTPRTDAAQAECDPNGEAAMVEAIFARQLERELAVANGCVAIANRSADDQMEQKREAERKLAAALAEVERLKAGGCARNQKTKKQRDRENRTIRQAIYNNGIRHGKEELRSALRELLGIPDIIPD